jgi:hypothetical protein
MNSAQDSQTTNLLNRFLMLDNCYYYYCHSCFIYTELTSFLFLPSWRTEAQLNFIKNILLMGKSLRINRLHIWTFIVIWHDTRVAFPNIKISVQYTHEEKPVTLVLSK